MNDFEFTFNSQQMPIFLPSPVLYDITPRTSSQRNWHEYVDNSELAAELSCKSGCFLILFFIFKQRYFTVDRNISFYKTCNNIW